MRIAIVCGAALWLAGSLAGCNELPPEPVNGDDLPLTARAGSGSDPNLDAGVPAKKPLPGNDVAPAASDDEACLLKAKQCYADGNDAKVCESILASCMPPKPGTKPEPGCGDDCDAEVRACFAKGLDAKTCDANYHECLGDDPIKGDPGKEPGNDPALECQLKYKSCVAADPNDPSCDQILESCNLK